MFPTFKWTSFHYIYEPRAHYKIAVCFTNLDFARMKRPNEQARFPRPSGLLGGARQLILNKSVFHLVRTARH
jgi:hypothetical protein